MTSGRTARVHEGERNSRRDVRPGKDGGEEDWRYRAVWR